MAGPCIFCKIVEREIAADIVHDSDRVLAFRDTNPQAPVHILLIPKEHVPSVRELGEEHAAAFMELLKAAAHLAKAEGIDRDGWRLVTNVGAAAGQTVFHLHVHLLGGRQMTW